MGTLFLWLLLSFLAIGLSTDTSTYAILTFDSTVKLQNVTTSSWSSTSKKVVINALAATLDINSNRIVFVSEDSKKWSSKLYEIDASFKITSHSSDYSNTLTFNTTELYDYVTSMLIESANNYNFVRSVKFYAHLSHEDNLEAISRASFDNSESDSNSSDDDFSTQDTFGVVVAGVLLVTVIGAICFFYVFCVYCYPKTLLEGVSGRTNSGKGATYTDIETNVKQTELSEADESATIANVEADGTSVVPVAPPLTSSPKASPKSPKLSKKAVEETKVEEQVSKDVALGEINEYYPN